MYAATTRPLVEAVLRGYSATVFAYGATGAGKTHTMVGPEDAADPSQQGVMVRALNELFGQAAHLGDRVCGGRRARLGHSCGGVWAGSW